MCKNKSAECVQPDEYPVGIFQQWLQHTLATERGPRAPLMFYIEARSLYETRRHHREGATTENTQDSFAWGRFGRQLIAFADSRRWMCGVLANDSNSVDWHTAEVTIFTQFIFPRHPHDGSLPSITPFQRGGRPRGRGEGALVFHFSFDML